MGRPSFPIPYTKGLIILIFLSNNFSTDFAGRFIINNKFRGSWSRITLGSELQIYQLNFKVCMNKSNSLYEKKNKK